MNSSPEPRTSNPIIRLLDTFTGEQVRAARVELGSLSRGDRWVAIGGYVVFFALVVLTLVLELLDTRLLGFAYPAEGIARQISWVAILGASLGFAIGWSYVFAGANQARWYVGAIVYALFGLIILIALSERDSIPEYIGLALVTVALVALAWLTHKKGWHQNAVYIPLLGSIIALALAIGAFWMNCDPGAHGADASCQRGFYFRA